MGGLSLNFAATEVDGVVSATEKRKSADGDETNISPKKAKVDGEETVVVATNGQHAEVV